MTFKFEQPPVELTWYYLSPLLAADVGTLKYDKNRYRVSGVSNNAVACVWADLLAADDDGLVLTDLGRSMLADWKASPKGRSWFAEQNAFEEPAISPEPSGAEDQAAAVGLQLDLFGAAS